MNHQAIGEWVAGICGRGADRDWQLRDVGPSVDRGVAVLAFDRIGSAVALLPPMLSKP